MDAKVTFKLPECEKCAYRHICREENIERHSLFCLWNFYDFETVEEWYQEKKNEYQKLIKK